MKLFKSCLVLAAMLLLAGKAPAQHGHLNAGAVGQNQNDQLVWANGAEFAAGSGYVQEMAFATSGRYAGLFNSGPTFTALSLTNAGGPAAGSFLTAEIVSVLGPAGGQFAFWEGEDLGGGSSPLFSIVSGGTGLSYQFALSDASLGAGIAGQDPFGHIHGRRFTTTAEGLYTVGFRVLDTSMNGTGVDPSTCRPRFSTSTSRLCLSRPCSCWRALAWPARGGFAESKCSDEPALKQQTKRGADRTSPFLRPTSAGSVRLRLRSSLRPAL